MRSNILSNNPIIIVKIERRLAGFYVNGQSNNEFSFGCRLLLRDPVRSYVPVTRR